MALTPLLAMVRKDLLLFFSDRRAVIMSFAVPIAIASFFGSIFGGPSRNAEPARVPVAIVDQDGSTRTLLVEEGRDSCTLRIESPKDSSSVRLRIRAMDARGLGSRPARLRVNFSR